MLIFTLNKTSFLKVSKEPAVEWTDVWVVNFSTPSSLAIPGFQESRVESLLDVAAIIKTCSLPDASILTFWL